MKISIITVCYNSSTTIRDTIVSVLNQDYNDIEYIIVDGLSSDNTLEIVHEYRDKIKEIISEEDAGLYDAMNKGLMCAAGRIIGFLNSDDIYASASVLTDVVNTFKKQGTDSVYGNLVYVDKINTNIVKRQWTFTNSINASFKSGWHPPHPSLFIRKEIYLKHGNFDINLRLAADFDLMLRFLEYYKVTTFYLPQLIVKMRLGGESNNSFKNIIFQNIEIMHSFKKYNIKINPYLYLFKRIVPKILNLLKIKIFYRIRI
tara:strand:- start:93 stop:869 length:777 start_codon:yes stop_codon:yes gene_type:complete